MARLSLVLMLTLVACQTDDDPASDSNPSSFEEAEAHASRPTARYLGSKTCRLCHESAWNAWAPSQHALAERPIDLEVDASAFETVTVEHGSLTSEVELVDGRPTFRTLSRNGEVQARVVERVLGVSPLRQYLVPASDGRFQPVSLAHDPHRGEWFDVFGQEDRRPEEWGFWDNRGLNWNSMCADCHNTGYRKAYDASRDGYDSTWTELGVGCEACHGPGSAHVDWQREHGGGEEPDPHRDDLLLMGRPERWVEACGRCHARRGKLQEAFLPGDRMLESYLPEVPGPDEVWYADGQVHEENYEYTSFRLSRMHERGINCLSCHLPHQAKLRKEGNALCLECHEKGPDADSVFIDEAAHSHHVPGTPGGQCVDCHMPETTYMERDPRRDHGFTLPDPRLTQEHGVPNACGRCHVAEGVDWAIAQAEEWYGDIRERPSQKRARLIARARTHEQGIEGDLLVWSRAETSAAWRATSARLLSERAFLPSAHARLIQLLEDADPWVRTQAAWSLDGFQRGAESALRSRLEDPVRGVRVAAAWALRGEVVATSSAGRELEAFLDLGRDQPAGLHLVAGYHWARGEMDESVAALRTAVRWDPFSPPLQLALAELLTSLQRPEEALLVCELACEKNPRDAELQFALGLSRAESNDIEGAEKALERTVELEPRHARAWYNLGLLRHGAGRSDQAIDALLRATTALPESSDLWYGLAAVCRDVGQIERARWAIGEGLRLAGEDPRLLALQESLR